jgi:hypothetical protein
LRVQAIIWSDVAFRGVMNAAFSNMDSEYMVTTSEYWILKGLVTSIESS